MANTKGKCWSCRHYWIDFCKNTIMCGCPHIASGTIDKFSKNKKGCPFYQAEEQGDLNNVKM